MDELCKALLLNIEKNFGVVIFCICVRKLWGNSRFVVVTTKMGKCTI